MNWNSIYCGSHPKGRVVSGEWSCNTYSTLRTQYRTLSTKRKPTDKEKTASGDLEIWLLRHAPCGVRNGYGSTMYTRSMHRDTLSNTLLHTHRPRCVVPDQHFCGRFSAFDHSSGDEKSDLIPSSSESRMQSRLRMDFAGKL